jgi:predicted RNA-binding protein with TRAM domain
MENFGGRRRYGGGGGGSRRFGGDNFSSQDKPVKEGETYDVEIIEVGSRGDGIAKIQNFVIFVPGTNKGDKIKIRITKVRSSSAIGEVVTGEGEPERIVVKESAESSEESEEEESEESEAPAAEPKEEPKGEPEETGEEEPSE